MAWIIFIHIGFYNIPIVYGPKAEITTIQPPPAPQNLDPPGHAEQTWGKLPRAGGSYEVGISRNFRQTGGKMEEGILVS